MVTWGRSEQIRLKIVDPVIFWLPKQDISVTVRMNMMNIPSKLSHNIKEKFGP